MGQCLSGLLLLGGSFFLALSVVLFLLTLGKYRALPAPDRGSVVPTVLGLITTENYGLVRDTPVIRCAQEVNITIGLFVLGVVFLVVRTLLLR